MNRHTKKGAEKAADEFITRLKESFSISPGDARRIMDDLHGEMRAGLAGKHSSLKMLPSFVGRPRGSERGRFLALDLGGTNIRVLAVDLDGKGKAGIAARSKFAIPRKLVTGAVGELFNFIADCIGAFFVTHKIAADRDYSLGFTFSFPLEQRSLSSGKLITWTKGFTADGVRGRDVSAMLSRSLNHRKMNHIRVAALVNDAVGTFAAGGYAHPACDMGVIIGTGTNASYPEKRSAVAKCPGYADSEEMVINMEWGGFDKLAVNEYDRAVDAASNNPGRQHLEKMVSGMYLGEIVRRVILDLAEVEIVSVGHTLPLLSREYGLTAEHLSRIVRGPEGNILGKISKRDRDIIRQACRIVSTRSARIAASSVAAVITWMDADLARDHRVAVDGALFEKYPGYHDAMSACLKDLFPNRAGGIGLCLTRDGSGTGSAIIAAIANSFRGRT